MDDKQFEQRMNLAKKSYDRMESTFNAQAVIEQLQEQPPTCPRPQRQKWRKPITILVSIASFILLVFIIYSAPRDIAMTNQEKLLEHLHQQEKEMQQTLGLSDEAMKYLEVTKMIAYIKEGVEEQFINDLYTMYVDDNMINFQLPPTNQNFGLYEDLLTAYNSDLWDGKLTPTLIKKAQAQHIELVTQNKKERFYLRLPQAVYDELDDQLKNLALYYQYGNLNDGNYTSQELQPILQAYERLLLNGEDVLMDYVNGLAFVLANPSDQTRLALQNGAYGEVAKEAYLHHQDGVSRDLLQYELAQQFNIVDTSNYTEFGMSIDANLAVMQDIMNTYTPSVLMTIREQYVNTAIFYILAKQQGIDVSSFTDRDYEVPLDFNLATADVEIKGHADYGKVQIIFKTEAYTITLPMYSNIEGDKLLWRIGKA
ncbi:hypothetical protein BN1050_02745 [Metalysinibacillus saudimassiliensis]|uniref:Uncharacterized protein n=1 Tax=Metalysinibacillus saudimassiliensis TaxID=1461583 RepID=A0A078MKL6_9BACL|nr:hypothetical protein BN1050_02745 [Metalysinibacillus saudimassiliensis]